MADIFSMRFQQQCRDLPKQLGGYDPDALLKQIFLMVDPVTRYTALKGVCKHWYIVMGDDVFRKNVELDRFKLGRDSSLKAIEQWCSEVTQSLEVKVLQESPLQSGDLSTITALSPSLQRFYLDRQDLRDIEVQDELPRNLTTLGLIRCLVSEKNCFHLFNFQPSSSAYILSGLKHLDLSGTLGLNHVSKLPPRLETLILTNTDIILTMSDSWLHSATSLKQLDLSLKLIDPNFLFMMSRKLTNLIQLDLRGCILIREGLLPGEDYPDEHHLGINKNFWKALWCEGFPALERLNARHLMEYDGKDVPCLIEAVRHGDNDHMDILCTHGEEIEIQGYWSEEEMHYTYMEYDNFALHLRLAGKLPSDVLCRPDDLTIDSLPDNILVKIFSYLPPRSRYSVVNSVCKRWNQLMKSRTFQTRVWLDWLELKMCRKAARMAIKRWCSSVTQSIHLKMRQKEPQERGNIVKYCSTLKSEDLTHIGKKCPNLKDLVISDEFLTLGVDLLCLPQNLTHLGLRYCGSMEELGRQDILFSPSIKGLKNLTSLDLTGSKELRCLRDSTLPENLVSLSLCHTEILLGKWVSTLVRHTKLRHLDLGLNLIDQYVLYRLSKKLNQVTFLELGGCVMIKEGHSPCVQYDDPDEHVDTELWEEIWTQGFKSLERLDVCFLLEHDGSHVPPVIDYLKDRVEHVQYNHAGLNIQLTATQGEWTAKDTERLKSEWAHWQTWRVKYEWASRVLGV